MSEYLTLQDIRNFASYLDKLEKPKYFTVIIHPFNKPFYEWNYLDDRKATIKSFTKLVEQFGLHEMWKFRPWVWEKPVKFST